VHHRHSRADVLRDNPPSSHQLRHQPSQQYSRQYLLPLNPPENRHGCLHINQVLRQLSNLFGIRLNSPQDSLPASLLVNHQHSQLDLLRANLLFSHRLFQALDHQGPHPRSRPNSPRHSLSLRPAARLPHSRLDSRLHNQ
jgi:hypothetical protein